jgi:hypothetical protein
MIQPPEKSDPYRSCIIDVEGPRADLLVDEAIRQAAVFLRELPADLYAANVGQAMATQRSKYRRHLGEQGAAIRWRATITVRLRPEIVKQRRGEPPDPPERKGLHVVT